jgi:hypothetical protein
VLFSLLTPCLLPEIIDEDKYVYVTDAWVTISSVVRLGPKNRNYNCLICIPILFIYFIRGVRPSPPGTQTTSGSLYQPRMVMIGGRGAVGGMGIGRGNQSTRRTPAPSATCSILNLTCPDLRSNTGRRGGRPENNRLSYSTALCIPKWYAVNEPFFI